MFINKKREIQDRRKYLKGVTDALKLAQGGSFLAFELDKIVEDLGKMANNMCGQGFLGCNGGENCPSSHK